MIVDNTLVLEKFLLQVNINSPKNLNIVLIHLRLLSLLRLLGVSELSNNEEIMEMLKAILNHAKQAQTEYLQTAERLEKDLGQVEKRLGQVEARIESVENRFRLPETRISVEQLQEEKRNQLSPREKNVFDAIVTEETHNGFATLNNLREELKLDYRTIAGYTNRFVKRGLLRVDWDPENRVNHYHAVR